MEAGRTGGRKNWRRINICAEKSSNFEFKIQGDFYKVSLKNETIVKCISVLGHNEDHFPDTVTEQLITTTQNNIFSLSEPIKGTIKQILFKGNLTFLGDLNKKGKTFGEGYLQVNLSLPQRETTFWNV